MENQRRKFITRLAGLGGLAATPIIGRADSSPVEVKDIRLSNNREYTRLVFDLSQPVKNTSHYSHQPNNHQSCAC